MNAYRAYPIRNELHVSDEPITDDERLFLINRDLQLSLIWKETEPLQRQLVKNEINNYFLRQFLDEIKEK